MQRRRRWRKSGNTLQRGREPLVSHGFQQVIQGIHLESPQSKFIERRYEDQFELATHLLEKVEAGVPRHLTIQENYIGPKFMCSIKSLGDRIRFRHHLYRRKSCKLPAQLHARQALIVHQKRALFHAAPDSESCITITFSTQPLHSPQEKWCRP